MIENSELTIEVQVPSRENDYLYSAMLSGKELPYGALADFGFDGNFLIVEVSATTRGKSVIATYRVVECAH